jgi:hypothetical protein
MTQDKDQLANTGKIQRPGFKPGRSGNPQGKPKGTRNKALVALDAIGEANAREILQAAVDAAKGGDMRAIDTILSRVWPARKGRPVALDLPAVTDAAGVLEALSRITQATAAGEITPDEGQALAGLLEVQRRAIETQELEARIAALEAQK